MATIAKNHIPKLRDVLLTEGFELDALAGCSSALLAFSEADTSLLAGVLWQDC